MRPNPSFLVAGLLLASTLALTPGAEAAPNAAAPAAASKDSSKAAPAKTPEAAPIPANPAVFRASGTTNPAGSPGASAEALDTASADEPLTIPESTPAPIDPATSAPAESLALPHPQPRKDSVLRVVEPTLVEAPGLSQLKVGGTFQLKALAHDIGADSDKDKDLSFQMRRARLDFFGNLDGSFAFEGQFLLEGDGRRLGTEAVYLAYKWNDLIGIKGGKIKRPFSQEALTSSKHLHTVERGTLYQNFLAATTGYSAYDLGMVFYGGFVDEDVPVTYEAGVFNGRQSANGYSGQHYEGVDLGLKSKDAVFRITAQPFQPLKVEAAVSTKAAEDTSDADNYAYQVNTGYQLGADFKLGRLRLLGEAAWGDNHGGNDARILSGSSLFFAFYAMGVWHEDYSRGRSSEMVLKMEGLDPDFEPGSGDGAANDGTFRYTLGCNYGFTPAVSVLVNYGLTQPITKIPGEDELTHDLEAMWRMNF